MHLNSSIHEALDVFVSAISRTAIRRDENCQRVLILIPNTIRKLELDSGVSGSARKVVADLLYWRGEPLVAFAAPVARDNIRIQIVIHMHVELVHK